MFKQAHINHSRISDGLRLFKLIGSLSLLFFLAACTGNQLSLGGSEKKANPDEIVLDEKGLPSIAQLMKAALYQRCIWAKKTRLSLLLNMFH